MIIAYEQGHTHDAFDDTDMYLQEVFNTDTKKDAHCINKLILMFFCSLRIKGKRAPMERDMSGTSCHLSLIMISAYVQFV